MQTFCHERDSLVSRKSRLEEGAWSDTGSTSEGETPSREAEEAAKQFLRCSMWDFAHARRAAEG